VAKPKRHVVVCRRCGRRLLDKGEKLTENIHCNCDSSDLPWRPAFTSRVQPPDLDWYDKYGRSK